jgi:hypothetical protein
MVNFYLSLANAFNPKKIEGERRKYVFFKFFIFYLCCSHRFNPSEIYFSSLNKFNFFTQFVFFSNKTDPKTTKQMRILETIETVIENRQFASTQIRFWILSNELLTYANTSLVLFPLT